MSYYSLIEIGQIAGYLPDSLPVELVEEIKYFLNNKYLKRYYKSYYKLYLPQLLLQDVNKDNFPSENEDPEIINENQLIFEQFLLIKNSIEDDNDVYQFLWFLDDGHTNGYRLKDFREILKSREEKNKLLDDNPNSILNKTLRGYVKYLQFLSEYAQLLRRSNHYKLLQSAFWHFQSYWFKNMSSKLGKVLYKSIQQVTDMMVTASADELIADKWSFIETNEGYNKLFENTDGLISLLRGDIEYLLNPVLGRPIIDAINPDYGFEKILEEEPVVH